MTAAELSTQDYRSSFDVSAAPADVFDKICRVTEWWGHDVTGNTTMLGDTFTIRFGTTWVDFNITELMPDKSITWHVTDSHLPWLNDKAEWTDTDVVWEVSAVDGVTTVAMTHRGLLPASECYAECKKGWDFYAVTSLKQLITDGVGRPEGEPE